MKNILYTILVLAGLSTASCTDLTEELRGETSRGNLGDDNINALMDGLYITLRTPYQGNGGWWALQQTTSDETIPPTRGGDWDDNGAWRALFLHRWQFDHPRIDEVFKNLNSVSYAATDILTFSPSVEQDAEARFVRAYVQFDILDGWGQVPYRDPGEPVTESSRVRQAPEQIEYLTSELEEILPNLADNGPLRANPDAAKFLLMKLHLNKAVFLNRENPTFEASDMSEVVRLADEIINSGSYALETDYYQNFAVDNHNSSELIFASANAGGENSGNLYNLWNTVTHYNMNPSGWNGFATLSDVYDRFENGDQRRGGPYPGMTEVGGVNIGFLIGQQYNRSGVALQDRRGNPLIFTPEVSIIERGNNLEVTGIRVIKYVIDYANLSTNLAGNDWVLARYADVLLMKAEALLRQNNASAALAIVNELRGVRGASQLSSLTLDNLLDERSRELFWEGHRRTDLVRFGRYLSAWQEKPADADSRALLFPIPQTQMGNPNYTQNPLY